MSYVTERPSGREHIPLYPKGFVAVRIIQLVLGVICLGLTAYATAAYAITGAILLLFTSIVGVISSIYLLVAHFGPPAAYNYWAILGLDIFHVVFWLISFALLAAQAALILSYYEGYDVFVAYGSIIAAAAGLGAVNWVVYLVALIMHSIALHRHRKAGLHAMPGKSASAPTTGAPPVATTEVQMQPQQPQAYYPPQQVHQVSYQQQPQPPQQVQQQQQPYQQPTY
ncbi:hypothetical protein F4824DRAFT_220636 [Ustulina deusta]|nr:hypothetical protein F4823DRAFT_490195 [Ustulina deusta]KAI3333989.1 hypothetical protein F4824DRAFT_220636 [Ustulina deusta]